MKIDQIISFLDSAENANEWLASVGINNIPRAHANITNLARAGFTLDLLANIVAQLERHLPTVSDADMALNNLERFVQSARSPISLGALMERDPTALPILLKIFSTSQYLSDSLIRDPESYDLLRLTEGMPVPRRSLIDELCGESSVVSDSQKMMAVLRRFKHREILRVAYGDIIGYQPIDSITAQLSYVADAICEAALRFAIMHVTKKRGRPIGRNGQPARFVILALGKLGGNELNYSSDIDLMMLYDVDGQTDGRPACDNRQFFEQVTREVLRLLTESTELGTCYRVDLRLRPEGGKGPLISSFESALNYYDLLGRTWERQAFVKARPIAGDLELGGEFLQRLEPWIYRRYLSRADITGIKALKRKIEQRVKQEGKDRLNVKTGNGGIRDIEFTIQFLQLLNGTDLPEVRSGNTLQAIAQLEKAGCLTQQESNILLNAYAFLRKIEHRLQIMFDLQTHNMPDRPEEFAKLAVRMGYKDQDNNPAADQFREELAGKTTLNRRILNHLLHDAFEKSHETDPVVDLILDPNPTDEQIRQGLAEYGFQDCRSAYQHLIALSQERIRFLSTRRCRHFLAAIVPSLLQEIAATPNPDFTLVNLSQVSDSLGGKGMLWELFSFNRPSMKLYVRLCASSPYLSGILTSNPGMIDELMDSLMIGQLPDLESLQQELADLTRAAEDIHPIVQSFKNSQHLSVGVRDILGKDDIRETHRVLSDIAEVCLNTIADHELRALIAKHGQPILDAGPRKGEPCEMIILGMGKLGGREPNYHSDLDVVFLYEGDGHTNHRRTEHSTSNNHFFSMLSTRISKAVNKTGPVGKLYELDSRLRPSGRSGAPVISLKEFLRYFEEGRGQLWERQALCKARPIFGSPAARDRAMQVVLQAIDCRPWQPEFADEIKEMRFRMQENASATNLKRGIGGTVDIEFAVQLLQLKHQHENPQVLQTGTFAAMDALHEHGFLRDDEYQYFRKSYRFLRDVESRLRLLNTTARHDLPGDPHELAQLAYLLNYESAEPMVDACRQYREENRRRFLEIVERAGQPAEEESASRIER